MGEAQPIRVLLVEDEERDAALLIRELRKLPRAIAAVRVDELQAVREQLTTNTWDVLLADYVLRGFTAVDVLEVAKSLAPDMPVIVVSGKVGEDTAVGTMISGARDYVTKDNLRRLCPAIEREMAEAVNRRQRSEAEAALAETRARERMVMNSAPIVLFAADRNGVITLSEGSALHSLGISPGARVGRHLSELFPHDPVAHQHVLRALSGQSGELELTVGDTILDIRYVPNLSVTGELLGCTGFAIDITDRVTAERELRRAQERLSATFERSVAQAAELSRSNAELTKFAYAASHDLQEPLRKVSSFCELLEQRYGDKLDSQGVQYIHFAVDGARRMQELIRDLLDWSRVGRADSAAEAVDLNEVLSDALDSLSTACEESGAAITSDALPTIECVRSREVQLFQNLISNAIKFRSDCPPHIHVGARRAAGGWQFSVTDDGIGIEEDYHERIFEIFQRLHTREEYPGTGVGLSLCKKIVESDGGRMWVESTPGEGSTFFWTCPEAA